MFGRRGKESICIYQVAGRSSTRAGGGTKLRSSQLTSQEGMQVGYMSSLQHSRGRLIRQKAYKGSYDTVVEDLGRMLLLLVLLEIHSIYRHVCGRNRHPRLLHLLSAICFCFFHSIVQLNAHFIRTWAGVSPAGSC